MPSFFSFFKSYDITDDVKHKKDDDDGEEEEEMDIEEIMEDEYNAGLFIKEELIPYAIEYYLDLIEDEEEFDDAEEDEEDEEEEENFGKKPRGKK